jgi:hypothetical protein
VIPARITGATRAMGKDQPGYTTLWIRDEVIVSLDASGEVAHVPSMTSLWEPTPDEIAKIAAGAPIKLMIIGTSHPPVWLAVGEVPK